MSNQYLSFTTQTVEVVTYPYTGYTTASLLNLRSEPSTSSTALLSIAYASEVEVLGKAGDWLKISYNDQVGYVSASYITTTKPAQGGNDSTSGSDGPVDSGDPSIDSNATTVQNI